MDVTKLDEELNSAIKGKTKEIFKFLINDEYTNSYLEQANKLAITRIGYNDHGKVHSKIVALNSLKIFDIVKEKVKPNVIKEEVGNEEDAANAILLGAYLHDIGCAIARESHEIFGITIAKPVVDKALSFYPKSKAERIAAFVFEEIACHMGTCQATSLEAKIVEVADGTDITKGRGRIPFHIGYANIHKFSVLAIDGVEITKGEEKPVRIDVSMENPAGVFQAEETLLKKIKDANFTDCVEIIARIKGEREIRYL